MEDLPKGWTAQEVRRGPLQEAQEKLRASSAEPEPEEPKTVTKRKTVSELRELAAERDIEGYSSMKKGELLDALDADDDEQH